MALSKEKTSRRSQLENLVDLLIDLQIMNSQEKSIAESPPAPEEGNEENSASELSPEVTLNNQEGELVNGGNPGAELSPEVTLSAQEGELVNGGNQGAEFSPEVTLSAQEGELVNGGNQGAEFSPEVTLSAQKGELVNVGNPGAEFSPENSEISTQETLPTSHSIITKERDYHQENTSPEVFNQLVKSHWQKVQQKKVTSQLLGVTNEQDVENSITLFERWQRLLLTQEVIEDREKLSEVQQQVKSLENQINEPTELINLLLPLIGEVLSLKVAQSRAEMVHAIAPVVDEMIQHRAEEDILSISAALAPVLPEAVIRQVIDSPGELARALGPEMSGAIKEQIILERDAMVDALYPVIGSTIAKYMGEVIRSINQKVESALSLEGIARKIRAKIKGVSEAELIFQESVPFTIQAIFLIHKASGLVIAEEQQSGVDKLESEMVGGMLTAIRSFVNDCIVQSGEISEIDQIEYGTSQITLEVAGYCYLAAVTKGRLPKQFTEKMRGTLEAIVQHQGKAIEAFDGDPGNVPKQIHQRLEVLGQFRDSSNEDKKTTPIGIIIVSLALLSGIFVPWGIHHYLSGIDRRYEEKTNLALATDPELAIYQLKVAVEGRNVKLSGRLPNQYLRSKAEQIAKKVDPELRIQNTIIPVEVPPDPVLAQGEVRRVTNILNQIQGAVISAEYRDGHVMVQGTVLQDTDAKKISEAFQQIPGVKSVSNTVQLQTMAIASRVYFDQGSSELKPEELSKVTYIRTFLDQYPNKHLQILAHTDPKGTIQDNQKLALERATKVKNVLINQGVNSQRLHVTGTTDPPIGVKAEQLPLLSRCVEFRMIDP